MKVAILGAGAYGIALSKVLCKNQHEVFMWTKFDEEKEMLLSFRENKKLLPGVKLDDNVLITTDIKKCIEGSKVIFLAIPMEALRSVLVLLEKIIENNQILCITSKGIEPKTGLFPSEVIKDVLDFENVVMLSGPSFAIELANGAETGFVVASLTEECASIVKNTLENERIVIEESLDIDGVQILATTKNIYAILLGILEGRGVSESTRASVLKCIINDSRKLLELLGGTRKTAYSYAGLGDLLLTCMSNKSRNFSFGENIAKTKNIDEAMKAQNLKTIEGLSSLKVIYDLLQKSNIKIKSIDFVYDIVYKNQDIDLILKNLI